MKRDNKRRMTPGVGYIGAGNKTFVFTRKPKTPFKRIKQIYDTELQNLKNVESKRLKKARKLTVEERLTIKNRIRTQIRKEQIRNFVVGIVSLIVVICFVYFMFIFKRSK